MTTTTTRDPRASVDGSPSVATWAWLPWAVGVGVFLVGVAPLLLSYGRWLAPQLRFVDLEVYRDAGISVLLGRPVYHFLTPVPQLLPFTYPPFAALLAIPLGLLPLGLAQALWTAGQLGLLLWIVSVAFRPLLARAGLLAPVALGAAGAAVAWIEPVRDGLRFGQVGLLLTALVLAYYAVRAPRWPRGMLIGLATALKLTPGVFIVHLWLSGRRREALTAAGTAVAATVGTFLLIPRDSGAFWFGALFQPDRLGVNAGTSNQSVRGMLLRSLLPGPLQTVLVLAALTAVAVVGFRLATRASRSGHDLGGMAIVGLLAVLLSPVAWIHHLAWFVVGLGVLVGDGRDRARVRWALAAWGLFVMRLPWWGEGWLWGGLPHPLARLAQDSFGLAAILLLFVLGWAVRRDTVLLRAPADPRLADAVPADAVPADAVPADAVPADAVPAHPRRASPRLPPPQ